jgi:leader peptidase (prepilin peptidase)/N-methyltransferase
LLSWILLRGRCRSCQSWISPRYPLVELAMGLLWAGCWVRFGLTFALRFGQPLVSAAGGDASRSPFAFSHDMAALIGYCLLCWILVALAALDAEFFWLPDLLTLPGIALGFAFTLQQSWSPYALDRQAGLLHTARNSLLAILAAGGLILFIRLAYWIVRRQEGMGLGDAKLMAMLAAWLGIRGAMECFALSILGAAAASFLWLAILAVRRNTGEWARMPLPLGTFLCLAALAEVFYPEWLLNWWQPGL